ncbi:Uncharacterised protein g4095 [Pycnogonum litorale]
MLNKIMLLCLLTVAFGAPQHNPIDYGPAEPYQMSYEWKDDYGNVHSRSESGDANGWISGVHSTKLINGLYRIVEYNTNDNGYTATVSTNEPGTGPEAPASTIWKHEAPPAGIYGDRGPRSRATKRRRR